MSAKKKMEQNNQQTGQLGENIATDYLQKKGYLIHERNWRHKHCEVDIIASLGKILHFVEVKTRFSLQYGYPEESISKEKMQHLKYAATAYQFRHPQWKYIQFDVIAITLYQEIVKELFFIEDVYF